MRHLILLTTVGFLVVGALNGLHAQEPAPLKVGDRVRVEWNKQVAVTGATEVLERRFRVEGEITTINPEGIIVIDADQVRNTIPFMALEQDQASVARSLGKKNRWLQSLGLGLLIGPGIAYAITEQADPGWGALGALAFGVPAGVVGGLVVGSSLSRERWEPLGLNSIRATPVADIHGRLGVSVSLPVSW